MNKKLIRDYTTKRFKNVNGWLSEGAVKIIYTLNNIQSELNISGNIAEIGVHHGKLFILLYLLLKNDEYGVAIDLFGFQDLNLDRSGKGNKKIFLKNLKKYAKNTNKLKIIERDSTTVKLKDIFINKEGYFRLFSVDGGHTAELTLNDLSLSKEAICKGGIIILDDYFNENWPGVSVGTNIFMNKNSEIYPFAIGGNKLFFTNDLEFCDIYKHKLLNKFKSYKLKFSTMWGHQVLIIDFNAISFKEKIQRLINWEKLQNTKIGKIIHNIYSEI